MNEFGIRCKIYEYSGEKAVNLIVVEDRKKFFELKLIRKAVFKKGPLAGRSKIVRFIK